MLNVLFFTIFDCKITAFLAYTQAILYVVQHKSTKCCKKVRAFLLIVSNLIFLRPSEKVRI